MNDIINQSLLDQAMTYAEYRDLIDDLLLDNRTTGSNQSESMINYARMGQKRMRKWDKIAKPKPELVKLISQIDKNMVWLVITEGWCGDAGQSIPFFHMMSELNEHLELKLVLRDEHPELMDAFLTNGARSIPILIAINPDDFKVLGSWGPRPAPIQREFVDNKRTQKLTNKDFSEYLHLWYAKDKGQTIQLEFLSILDKWSQKLHSSPAQVG